MEEDPDYDQHQQNLSDDDNAQPDDDDEAIHGGAGGVAGEGEDPHPQNSYPAPTAATGHETHIRPRAVPTCGTSRRADP